MGCRPLAVWRLPTGSRSAALCSAKYRTGSDGRGVADTHRPCPARKSILTRHLPLIASQVLSGAGNVSILLPGADHFYSVARSTSALVAGSASMFLARPAFMFVARPAFMFFARSSFVFFAGSTPVLVAGSTSMFLALWSGSCHLDPSINRA